MSSMFIYGSQAASYQDCTYQCNIFLNTFRKSNFFYFLPISTSVYLSLHPNWLETYPPEATNSFQTSI